MGVGAAAPTLAWPRRIEAAVRSEQPPDPRRAGAALGASPAPAPARSRTPGSTQSAHPRRNGARLAVPPIPGALRLLGAPAPRGRSPPPSPLAPLLSGFVSLAKRKRGGAGAEEAGAAAAGAERKWYARALEAAVAEDGGRRCRGSVGEVGESERGERGSRAPAGCGEARAALSLRPPHPGAPTLRATGLGSSSRRLRRRRHLEDRAKVWIWGRARS